MGLNEGIEVRGADPANDVLGEEALVFLADLHRRFEPRRQGLLVARSQRQALLDAGQRPDFCPQTWSVRQSDWTVAPVPKDLADRRVEITGPTDAKMMINALNSGATGFMADFEDSLTPTWANVVGGQRNLRDAVRGTIAVEGAEGRRYELAADTATLMVRPRGWHLAEKHVLVDGQRLSASLFDFGVAFFNNARELLDQGSGPYFYLPKLESHLEARLWNDVFLASQEALGLAPGTIKVTVLIETVLAALEMDEILYELREHAAGLNAGRWDYIFSLVKGFREYPDLVLPDRASVVMTVPFMRAYTDLLVRTCHRRRAHAIGGMAAFVPNRRQPDVTELALAKVRDDKLREAGDGFDGTWVAHPDLVPVATEVFNAVLGDRPDQLHLIRDDVVVTAADLLDVAAPGSGVTKAGLRTNVAVGIEYLESWLRGVGAAAISNLMEDAATAEICRAQVWQWVHHRAVLEEGPLVTRELVARVIQEEASRLADRDGRFVEARQLFERLALGSHFADFLTVPAYELID